MHHSNHDFTLQNMRHSFCTPKFIRWLTRQPRLLPLAFIRSTISVTTGATAVAEKERIFILRQLSQMEQSCANPPPQHHHGVTHQLCADPFRLPDQSPFRPTARASSAVEQYPRLVNQSNLQVKLNHSIVRTHCIKLWTVLWGERWHSGTERTKQEACSDEQVRHQLNLCTSGTVLTDLVAF